MIDPRTTAAGLAASARDAAVALFSAPTRQKDEALARIAAAVRDSARPILDANLGDLEDGRRAGLSPALLDRLALDEARLAGIATAVEAVRALPDPVGTVTDVRFRPNGLRVERVRIPLGVVLMVYEARPNVTTDAAALCLKSGNAAILRGGKEALRTNLALGEAVAAGIAAAGLPRAAVQLVPSPDRELLLELLKLEGQIDLAIPRGGEGLIRFVAEHARVPVVKHYRGVCHLYLDDTAPEDRATALAVNGKSRPGVCNALECLLVSRAAAPRLLPVVGRALVDRGIELRAEPEARALLADAGVPAAVAADDDFGREFLAPILAVKVVDGLDGALEHIRRYGSLHTEAIVTRDLAAADRFTREVLASCVLVNASTRFNDGGELGLGAEIGISTSKLHAFGPMGLEELTTRKFVVRGAGQVR
jgi:glutamate-5-semialdehyde dehydrogenase